MDLNEDADGDGITDYVYGTLGRDVLDLTFRGTYAFNRDLTLQAYVQPFVAVGDYSGHPQTRAALLVRILAGHDLVRPGLQHEVAPRQRCAPVGYVRGSTLFVVWDLSQADYSRPGAFRPWSDIGSAFGAEATHTLMVKLSYWINR